MEEPTASYITPPVTPIVPPTPNLEPEITPELPLRPTSSPSPILPILFGVIVVFVIASVLGGVYYFAKLKREIATTSLPTPTPAPSVVVESITASPSLTPSSTPTSSKQPLASTKPTTKPSPTPTPTPNPTTTNHTLDIRFGNPSGIIKQTIDENKGDGRVINREYNSLQIGEFDEVRSGYAPRVTACFQVVSNETIEGKNLGYTITQDDKVLSEGTLSQYDKLESGRLYAHCQDVATDLGSHTIRMVVNNAKSLGESNHSNNTARIDYRNLADNIAPNFTLTGPYDWGNNGTCVIISSPDDNVTTIADLVLEEKVDGGNWVKPAAATYCFTGQSGSSHSYAYRMTDQRGNKNEQSKTFNLY